MKLRDSSLVNMIGFNFIYLLYYGYMIKITILNYILKLLLFHAREYDVVLAYIITINLQHFGHTKKICSKELCDKKHPKTEVIMKFGFFKSYHNTSKA